MHGSLINRITVATGYYCCTLPCAPGASLGQPARAGVTVARFARCILILVNLLLVELRSAAAPLRRMPPPKQAALPPPTPVPSAPVPLAEKQVFRKGRRRKSPAALRNPEMERALRLQWSELLEHERDMLIAGAHSPAHVPSEQ